MLFLFIQPGNHNAVGGLHLDRSPLLHKQLFLIVDPEGPDLIGFMIQHHERPVIRKYIQILRIGSADGE